MKKLSNKTLNGLIATTLISSGMFATAQAQTTYSTGLTQERNLQTSIPEPVRTPTIHIIEQSLPDVLRQAARKNGYQITMTSRVRGTLRKVTLPLDMDAMLTKIAAQFDLKWHFQQNQVYVSVGSENTTRMIFLGNTKMKDLETALGGAGLKTQSYNLTHVEDSNSVIVNGPASYIASVELLAESLSKNKAIQRDKLKIIRFGNVSKN